MQLNSTRPIAGMVAMLFVFYLIYFLIASDPLVRLNRMCIPPFVWTGKVVSSGVRLFNPTTSEKVAAKFQDGFYACRRWGWNAFYQQSYIQMQAKAAEAKAAEVGKAATKAVKSAAKKVRQP